LHFQKAVEDLVKQ